MWYCSKCSEELNENFQVCWSCGTSRDGVEDPNFEVVVDDEQAPLTEPKRRFHFRSVFAISLSIILALSLLKYASPVVASFAASFITALLVGLIVRGGTMSQRITAGAISFAGAVLITLAVTAIADRF